MGSEKTDATPRWYTAARADIIGLRIQHIHYAESEVRGASCLYMHA